MKNTFFEARPTLRKVIKRRETNQKLQGDLQLAKHSEAVNFTVNCNSQSDGIKQGHWVMKCTRFSMKGIRERERKGFFKQSKTKESYTVV